MHAEAMDWLKTCRASIRVCEFGSYNVNGSARELFQGFGYVGIDTRPGPGVDIVADASSFDGRGVKFDYVITAEMLEHCEPWREVIKNAFRILKPCGVFFGTAAGPWREAHSNDGLKLLPSEYYKNINPNELELELKSAGFENVIVDMTGFDVRWRAIKPTQTIGN